MTVTSGISFLHHLSHSLCSLRSGSLTFFGSVHDDFDRDHLLAVVLCSATVRPGDFDLVLIKTRRAFPPDRSLSKTTG